MTAIVILLVLALIYFLWLWPSIEGLPPKNTRIKRQRLAGKLGLHDNPSVGELHLSDEERTKLITDVTYIDRNTFDKISKSNHFYLVEVRNSVLSIYCSVNEPTGIINYDKLQSSNFIRIPIEENLLVRFLSELKEVR